jgi:hypothetical protein
METKISNIDDISQFLDWLQTVIYESVLTLLQGAAAQLNFWYSRSFFQVTISVRQWSTF